MAAAPLPLLDALVVLGCRVGPQGRPSGALQRRLQRAAEAYRTGQASTVLVCGGRLWHGAPEAWSMRAHLLEQGLPERALQVELWSFSTQENARYAASLLHPHGLRRVGVITCDWHMPRALLLFRQAGFESTPLSAPSPSGGHRRLYRTVRERFSRVLDALS